VPPLPLVFTLRLGERFAPTPSGAALLLQIEPYFRHAMTQSASELPTECQNLRAPTSY
jgi:hypothetical protein